MSPSRGQKNRAVTEHSPMVSGLDADKKDTSHEVLREGDRKRNRAVIYIQKQRIGMEVRNMNSETTTTLSQRDAYKLMLKEYPDVMDIAQMCQILDVSMKTGYRLIREGKICCIKVGRAYRIPKAHLFTYLCIGC